MKKLLSVVLSLVAVLHFCLHGLGRPQIWPSIQLDSTACCVRIRRVGMLIIFLVYLLTARTRCGKSAPARCLHGHRRSALCRALFCSTVPSSSCRRSARWHCAAIASPCSSAMPLVCGGFFSGAVGNMFGDALSGFGLSPQWCVGNGLVGFIAGLAWLFENARRLNTVLAIGAALTVIITAMYLLNHQQPTDVL